MSKLTNWIDRGKSPLGKINFGGLFASLFAGIVTGVGTAASNGTTSPAGVGKAALAGAAVAAWGFFTQRTDNGGAAASPLPSLTTTDSAGTVVALSAPLVSAVAGAGLAYVSTPILEQLATVSDAVRNEVLTRQQAAQAAADAKARAIADAQKVIADAGLSTEPTLHIVHEVGAN